MAKKRISRPGVSALLLTAGVALAACTPQIQIPTEGPPPRWRQYEEALANEILVSKYPPNDEILCEWDLLGQKGREIYLWAVCQVASTDQGSAASGPAVVLLSPDGSVEKVIIPRDGVDYPEDIKELFPADVQELILNRTYFDPKAAMEHIALRRKDRTIPPMIVEAGVILP